MQHCCKIVKVFEEFEGSFFQKVPLFFSFLFKKFLKGLIGEAFVSLSEVGVVGFVLSMRAIGLKFVREAFRGDDRAAVPQKGIAQHAIAGNSNDVWTLRRRHLANKG